MADFAALTYQGAQETAQNLGKGAAESYVRGAQLAQHAENLQVERAKIMQDQQKVMDTRINNFTEALFKVQNFKNDPAAKKNYLNNVIPKLRDQWGLQTVFPDDTLKTLTASDDNIGRAYTLNLAVQDGSLKASDALAIANDPVKFADVKPTPESLMGGKEFTTSEAQKTFLDNQAKQASLNAQAERQQTELNSKAQSAASAKIGADYAKFTTDGGEASAMAKIAKLTDAANRLESGQIKTRTFTSVIPYLKSGNIQAIVNPELKQLMDDVQGAVTLKQSLDSQFSAKEAETVLSRAFDPALSPEANAKKIRAMIKELTTDVKNKMKAFNKEGLVTEPSATQETAPSAPTANISPSRQQAVVADIQSAPNQLQRAAEWAKKLGVSLDTIITWQGGQ